MVSIPHRTDLFHIGHCIRVNGVLVGLHSFGEKEILEFPVTVYPSEVVTALVIADPQIDNVCSESVLIECVVECRVMLV